MKPGKPTGGFRIVIEPQVQAMLDDVLVDFPEAEWRWDAVLAKLKATGHVCGVAVGSYGSDRADTFELDGWMVVLAWRVQKDVIYLKKATF